MQLPWFLGVNPNFGLEASELEKHPQAKTWKMFV